MNFQAGKEYTVIGISPMLATTFKAEIKVKDLNGSGYPIFSLRGKRKAQTFGLDVLRNALVFEGWDTAPRVDSEQTGSYIMRGNACINFLGTHSDIPAIRQLIQNNINEEFNRHDCIMVVPEGNPGHSEIWPVFPETETDSVVVKRIRDEYASQVEFGKP